MSRRNDCYTASSVAHPWLPITDVACGYDDRLTSAWCTGCHRARAESPLDQLQARDARHGVDGLMRNAD